MQNNLSKFLFLTELRNLGELVRFLKQSEKIPDRLAEKVLESLKNIKWNLVNNMGIRQAKSRVADEDIIVTQTHLTQFYQSLFVSKMKRLLKAGEDDVLAVGKRDVNGIRNFLIFNLMMLNDLRPCALYGLPLEYFLEGGCEFNTTTQSYNIPLYGDKTVGRTKKCGYMSLTGTNCILLAL